MFLATALFNIEFNSTEIRAELHSTCGISKHSIHTYLIQLENRADMVCNFNCDEVVGGSLQLVSYPDSSSLHRDNTYFARDGDHNIHNLAKVMADRYLGTLSYTRLGVSYYKKDFPTNCKRRKNKQPSKP